MNIEKSPLVTSLLRACKEADHLHLQQVLKNIIEHGITKNDLNSVDKNGRTALSYICASDAINVLDFLLQLPGIDVNKADNDGNTPLHFAAEYGKSDAIAMLTTRSRSLVIDAKNSLGLTPLMKAAVQGRTDCAKRLMLASASPYEKDTSRSLTPELWARFCGRRLCADAISQIVRMRNLRKTSSCKLPNEEVLIKKRPAGRSSSAIISSNKSSSAAGGLTTILRSVLAPFNKSKKLVSESDLPDLVTHMKMEKDMQPTGNVVPKVEITPANNQNLINKYKNRYSPDSYAAMEELPKIPLPPIRESFSQSF